MKGKTKFPNRLLKKDLKNTVEFFISYSKIYSI